MNYLIDSYTIYAASVLAANSVLRSLFGAIFPLFTNQMYKNLGIHWASSIPAFLALMCVPFPFLFYKYGARIRVKCKFARVAQEKMVEMMEGEVEEEEDVSGGEKREEEGEKAPTQAAYPVAEAETLDEGQREREREREREESREKDLEKGVL